MDIVLLIVVILVALLLCYVNVYLLALYCHSDDGGFGASFICKIVVILGLTLSWSQILMLALDVSNERSNGGLDMKLGWLIIYIAVFCMVVFFIPFSIFFYETDEDKPFFQRLCISFLEEFVVLIVSGLTLFLTYYWLKDAHIPVQVASVEFMENSSLSLNSTISFYQTDYSSEISMPVSIVTYGVALMCFIGYIFLVIFGGIGMSALPIDLIQSFRLRPVHVKKIKKFISIFLFFQNIKRSSAEAKMKKTNLSKRSKELIQFASQLKDEEKELQFCSGWFSKRQKSARIESGYAKLLNAVQELEEVKKKKELIFFKLELDKCNPLVYALKLLLGIVLMLVTIVWWIHLLLYVIIRKNGFPFNAFLNRMFINLEMYNINFLAVGFYAFFTMYLLWCVTKGNMKCGIQIPWILKFHPMKINETWMNSFLFNVVLILLASVAVTNFSTSVFSQYTRLTTVDLMFGIQIKYLPMFSWAFDNYVFEIALFVIFKIFFTIILQSWSILMAIIQCGCAVKKPQILQDLDKKKDALKKNQKNNDVELREFFLQK